MNRLKNETSPYLLQHADNPVDWYPWSQEAFEVAKRENKPVFLSIGYSTCHWCHVMERESFSDEGIAKIMNRYFVNIKVDREERPDVDSVYMTAAQAMTGSGGWPLSVFLTPEKKPFYAGTYFPPRETPGHPGFERLLMTIAQMWQSKRGELADSADKITEALTGMRVPTVSGELPPDVLKEAFKYLEDTYDDVYGGFGQAPKFPQPKNLTLLLNHWHKTGEKQAIYMVEKTLDVMAKGGICDHIGGGFHRYATDRQWFAPHFEKMLYDQALLSKVYVQAHQAMGKSEYAAIARAIYDYVLRDMTDAEGGFYAAEDADSEGIEGAFYLWKNGEIEKLLGSENAAVFNEFFDVAEEGNYEDAKNILHITRPIKYLAGKFGKTEAEIESILSQGRLELSRYRAKRPRPHRDDKIIAGWNGLMISSLAYAGAALNEPKYISAAGKSAEFILDTMVQDGRLARYYRAALLSNHNSNKCNWL